MVNKTPIIPVHPASFFETHHRLWQALSGLFQIRFRGWLAGDEQTASVVLMEEAPEALVRSVASRGGRCLLWAGREPAGVGGRCLSPVPGCWIRC